MYTRNRTAKAFTLVELLAVILIIGILMAIALPAYLSSAQSSKLATGTANARTMAAAIQSDYVRGGGASYAGYTTTNIAANANIVADLGGSIPSNPCSASAGAAGYEVTATATSWTVTPKVDLCPNAGTAKSIKLGN